MGGRIGIAREFSPFQEALEDVRVNGFTGLDLHGDEPRSLIEQDINLVAQVVPPKIEV